MPEELQSVKFQVGMLSKEVEVRGRQIDALLSKLDITADKIIDLTVEIKTLNSRQDERKKQDEDLRDELKLLHTRIGNVHDEIGNSERRVTGHLTKLEERVRAVEQYKSKLMGIAITVSAGVGLAVASIMGLLNIFKD